MYLLYICSYNILYYVFEINRIYYTTRVSIYLDIHICLCFYIYGERERESYCTLIQELHVSCYQETLVSIPIVPGFPAINTKHQNVL